MDGVASHPSLWEFKLKIMKGNRAITDWEAILSLIVPILFCQDSHPPFKNPRPPLRVKAL